MNPRIIGTVVVTIVAVVVLGGIGVGVYEAGVAQGVAHNVATVAPAGGAIAPGAVFAPYYGYRPPSHFWMFGWVFIPLTVFLMIAFFRFTSGHRYRGYGPGQWGEGIPPHVAEWHRQLHQTDVERTNS